MSDDALVLYAMTRKQAAAVRDVLCTPALSVPANQCEHMVALQRLFTQEPSNALEQLEQACRQRDAALLEAGLERKRADEAEQIASAANEALAKRITSDQDRALLSHSAHDRQDTQ
jgi:hypothetical protein